MGKPSYTSPQHALIAAPSTEHARCGKCNDIVRFTTDAIGRLRERCATCHGVAKPQFVRPGEVRRTQEIELGEPVARAESIALPIGVYRLPDVKPGQLRCQRCGHGLEGGGRFCESCRSEARIAAGAARRKPPTVAPPRMCPECQTNEITRKRDGKHGRPPQRCDGCETRRKNRSGVRCRCGAEKPKGRKKCDACVASGGSRARSCKKCGASDVPPLKQICNACRPKTGTAAAPCFSEKPCGRCHQPFIPTGSRSLYCQRPECRS